MTLYIYSSFLYSLCATLTRSMVQVFESNAGANFNQLVEYAVNSVACFFFMTALIFQILEWDLITQMVHHQGTNHLNMLEI